jgi:hypothetical protein
LAAGFFFALRALPFAATRLRLAGFLGHTSSPQRVIRSEMHSLYGRDVGESSGGVGE